VPRLPFTLFETDPMAAYYAAAQQQQQLDPQGWFGNLLGTVGKPLGQAIGGLAGNRGLGGTIGGIAGNLGRMLPFEADPTAAYYAAAQQQLDPQSFAAFAQRNPQMTSYLGNDALRGRSPYAYSNDWAAQRPILPFEVDPVTAAYAAQQQQLNPQGFFGGLLGGIAGGLGGGAIGGLFGNRGRSIGKNVGNIVGGIAGGILPFQVDPMAQAYGMYQ
jgi:predicted lipid-binding transport protein (Tim44 family)